MKTISVVAAIIKKENKVFITQRGHGEFKGKWEFPGGKVEEGETPEEAVVREIREELKSEVKVERFYDEINDKHGDKVLNVKFFICTLVSGDLELTEHLASKWVEPAEINDADFMPADKTVLDKLKNNQFGILGNGKKTVKKQPPLTTDEFRIAHSKLIEEFQWLEFELKDMYAKLIDGYYSDCFDEVAEKPLGKLIEKIKNIENKNNTHYLTDENYKELKNVKEMRNYWCHTCYVEGDGYLEMQSDMHIVSKSRGLIEKVKSDYEIVRDLEKKLGNIKIPEGANKWKLNDFLGITGVVYTNCYS